MMDILMGGSMSNQILRVFVLFNTAAKETLKQSLDDVTSSVLS